MIIINTTMAYLFTDIDFRFDDEIITILINKLVNKQPTIIDMIDMK